MFRPLCIVVSSENETLDGRLAPGFGGLTIHSRFDSKNDSQVRTCRLSPSLNKILLASFMNKLAHFAKAQQAPACLTNICHRMMQHVRNRFPGSSLVSEIIVHRICSQLTRCVIIGFPLHSNDILESHELEPICEVDFVQHLRVSNLGR